jgi:hypothetical protein
MRRWECLARPVIREKTSAMAACGGFEQRNNFFDGGFLLEQAARPYREVRTKLAGLQDLAVGQNRRGFGANDT